MIAFPFAGTTDDEEDGMINTFSKCKMSGFLDRALLLFIMLPYIFLLFVFIYDICCYLCLSLRLLVLSKKGVFSV